ncbi:PstS family phosphate ABC transporter substrate-binding protein [Tundrisphaera lichenicola]|uniref:PstS family phosphate ABC transporter substrate-binding protein n=1 Tax=Tundrisphaera lichenicola TaxID=2029860 RepID=UPI003EBA8B60
MFKTRPERRRSRHLWMLALSATLTLGGCGGGEASKEGSGESGTVVVDGSSTVYRISTAAQEGFAKVDGDVQVVVGNSGTGGGFTKYLRDEVDIVDASRSAKPEEEAKARSQGLDWFKFIVGYDGITVVVNPKNDFVKELTVDQLKKLWEPDSQVKTWKDLDPSWPDREIKLYSPDDKSGTFEFFTEAVVGKARSQRKDVQASSDDNILVRGVAGDTDGLGYFGYAYFKEYSETLRAVPIKKDQESPAVMPSPETILSKEYTPLSRPLFLYVKKKSYRRPAVAAFIKYYLANIGELATEAKYVPPTATDIQTNEAEVKPAS